MHHSRTQMFCKNIFPLSITMTMKTLLIVFVLPFVCGQDRKITAQLNPGCRACSAENTLVYIQAEGSHDTIHQIWDFTRGIPTMIYAIADVNSSISIVWGSKVPQRFNMSEKPKYSFAAVIDQLYEYDDIDDMGRLDNRCPQRAFPLRHMKWHLEEDSLSASEAMVLLRGKFVSDQPSNLDTIEIKLDMIPFEDYAVDLPHLIHTANSTLIDVNLTNLTLSQDYNSSRFALHFTLVSTDSIQETMRYTMRKSLDDEHTPGVFEIIEIKTPESYYRSDGGFLQFRPVAYTQRERSVTTSTIAHVSGFNRTSLPEYSTVGLFYRGFDDQNLLVQDLFVSFGEGGDGFYKQHNYTAWSFTLGYGAPPVESFSFLVLTIISIGLGVPILLALSGVLYVVTRRYRRRNTPRRFSDEE